MKNLTSLLLLFFVSACAYGQCDSLSFELSKSDPDCQVTNGSISVTNLHGTGPFVYTLQPLSLVNSTGVFTGLTGGNYLVRVKDQCGNEKARSVTLVPYQFDFSFTVTLGPTCGKATLHGTGATMYGYRAGGDTVWFRQDTVFTVASIEVFAKDDCGNLLTKTWQPYHDFLPHMGELQHNYQCAAMDLFPTYYGFTNPKVCLYETATGRVLQCKQATGNYQGGALTNFFDLPYNVGYTIKVSDDCYADSVSIFQKPAAGGTQLDPYDWDCSTFTMHVDGMEDTVCLYNYATGVKTCKGQDTVSINPRTGVPWPSGAVFTNLPYGRYYAWIFDPCTDSTWYTDSTVTKPFKIKAYSHQDCYGEQSLMMLSFDYATLAPYTIEVRKKDSTVLDRFTTSANNFYYYTHSPEDTLVIYQKDKCGETVVSYFVQNLLKLNRQVNIKATCPTATGSSGGGDLTLSLQLSNAALRATPTIIGYNGRDTLLPAAYYSTTGGDFGLHHYLFPNLPTGTYVVQYKASCGGVYNKIDTIVVPPYAYPAQVSPHLFQCGDNAYVFKDSAVNGLAPYNFAIVNTRPLLSSLITGLQTSNLFQIPPGNFVDSITLKAIDYCGNSTTKTYAVQKISSCTTLAADTSQKLLARLKEEPVRIYPNPSSGRFVVSFQQKKKTDYFIEVFHLSGIKVYDVQLKGVDRLEHPIRLSRKGSYLVRIRNQRTQEVRTEKLLVIAD